MFCFISSTDSWFDYPPRKTSPSSPAWSWTGFTSLVFALSGKTSDAGLILLIGH